MCTRRVRNWKEKPGSPIALSEHHTPKFCSLKVILYLGTKRELGDLDLTLSF